MRGLTPRGPDSAVLATKPTFDTSPFQACGRLGTDTGDGKTIHLWAQHPGGALAMDATATLA
jgi:3-methylfumaryl-CoA hydratase